ncbi:hypothetical protein DFJ74DRAFT_149065 [Hyaloraphidium curvatum]|nr:hypothetical protein DFJ74DRAFT_149065 [Hyaloraphidium curvatum]
MLRSRTAAFLPFLAAVAFLLAREGISTTNFPPPPPGNVTRQRVLPGTIGPGGPGRAWLLLNNALLFNGQVLVHSTSLPMGAQAWSLCSNLTRRAGECEVEVQAVERLPNNGSFTQYFHGTTLVAGIFNYPHYGHTLGNGVFNIFGTIVETAASQSFHRIERIALDACNGAYRQAHLARHTRRDGTVDVPQLGPLFSLLSNETLSWRYLVKQSNMSSMFFERLVLGISRTLDHYNVTNPNLLRSFSEVARSGLAPGSGGTASISGPRILVVHRNHSRRILNEAELLSNLSDWAHALQPPGAVKSTLLEGLSMAQTVTLMRHTDVLIGLDGTGLLNAVFMKYPCGAMIRLQNFGGETVLPSKGENFDKVAKAAAGLALFWECKSRSCAGLKAAQSREDEIALEAADTKNESAVQDLSYRDKFRFVAGQDLRVDCAEVLQLVQLAYRRLIERGCFSRLPNT